ncbi:MULTISPECIES: hypothetical protein [Burkholderiaceae]|jgi:hypothetical protein|uniref:Core-binding (CB) domain-containing protein n=1 Tax=Paraburkholderia fungorum TaxID=134537 RepID=A0AAW3V4F3_9BURK|nr:MULTISPECIES: hypothetical protein [Burkholderiaceae]AJZ56406.1 hypothetical protein OI25_8009 [Paraburkholderia fungorum]KHS13950.1 hypothetical protein BMD20_12440 [Burkholderia multivorans]MBB4519927.1 hypothetical protein [Paraburkholderia fungorum]MBB5546772.1 hypothetical protein [Paraburkholderia fungorum]MBB6205211.1 hypothetical protein [Paraburkholderia fungorum]
MGKRKIFTKTDLTTPQVDYERDAKGEIVIAAVMPPVCTEVKFGRNTTKHRTFDFAPWYGFGIDPLTYACQRQIERFLDKQDADVQPTTVVGYCTLGLAKFLTHMTMLSAAIGRPMHLNDVTRETIDSYLLFLRDQGIATDSQRTAYSYTKSVLQALGRRGLLHVIERGSEATFPRNPFPGSPRHDKGVRPLSVTEKRAFTFAVRAAVRPLFGTDEEPSATLAAYALLVVALHTGRNTTPLLEMRTDCLRAHPKEGIEFLVVFKRRGFTSSKVALRTSSSVNRIVESMPTLRATVAQLIRRVVDLTADLRREAPADIRDRVWLYRRSRDSERRVSALTYGTLEEAIKKLVKTYDLRGDNGDPMRVNVSRLRKTFVNRVYEILDGDVVATATAAGNSAVVTMRNYLRSSEETRKNWRFMGILFVEELLTNTLGASERTPVGRCSDTTAGEYAPKRNGDICQSFLNCLRCRSYAVTGDDLWRLFSFYFRILRERPRVDKRRWDRHLAHIPRLIERDVVQAGLRRKLFKPEQVNAARERARLDPHPFWASSTIIDELNSLA